MTVEIKVPALPESVADAVVATWHVKAGDTVTRGMNLVDLETDKVVLEVPATESGVIDKILQATGVTVKSGQVLAMLTAGAGAPSKPAPEKPVATTSSSGPSSSPAGGSDAASQSKPTAAPVTSSDNTTITGLSPAPRRMAKANDIDPTGIAGSGVGGRITKEDLAARAGQRVEKRVPMSRLRQKIAERLLQAQHQAAMLTTFNEINMQPVMDLRAKYKDIFEKTHGVKLGFMSFFTMAVVEALKRFPDVNASIDGQDLVYHGYFDVGIAVSTDRGLVVPVLRDADRLSAADIEKQIGDYAQKARTGKLTLEEMTGGNFTITNGGVFGSLLSTPILNPPQSAILGLHKIEKRPVVENDQIVIRPMMYVAMSYDHRMIDGKTSVSFLVAVKELLEDPARLMLQI